MQTNTKKSPTSRHYDVIIAGGGTAGIVAAIQVARAGQSCLLIEKTGLLGGTAITAGVNFPGLFHAWGKQVIAGIGWELVKDSVTEAGGSMPDFKHDERRHSQRQILIDRFTYAAVIDQKILASGVECLLHSIPTAAKQLADQSWQIDIASKEGIQQFHAKVLIDATGDANLVSIAGFPIRRNQQLQPGTLIFTAAGYDADLLDYPTLSDAARQAVKAGELSACDLGGNPDRVCSLLRNYGANIIHITGIDARTSKGKSEAEFKGRAALLRLQRFFKKQPQLEKFHISDFAPECGIRETVTIEGEVEITAKDYTSGRLWEDAICYSFYPIDLHADDGNGIDIRPLTVGTYPTLPLRALLPKSSRNIIVAGRIACGDKEANSAFRVQASCMAMGQAAAASAILACRKNCELREVPLSDIHALLLKHDAIVPGHKPLIKMATQSANILL